MEDMLKTPIVQLLAMWIYVGGNSLMDEPKLRDFMEEVIERLGMVVIMPIVSLRLPISNYTDMGGRTPDKEDLGYSLIAMISESHIALHTWPKHGKAFFEIASCKVFNKPSIFQIAETYFPGCKLVYRELEM